MRGAPNILILILFGRFGFGHLPSSPHTHATFRDERSALVPGTRRGAPGTHRDERGDPARSAGRPAEHGAVRGPAGGEFFFGPRSTKTAPKHCFRPLHPAPPPCPEPHFGPDLGCKFAQEWVHRGWEKIWHLPMTNPPKSPPNGVKMWLFNVQLQRRLPWPVLCFARRCTINSHSRRRRHHVDTSHATPVPKNRAPLDRGRAAPQAKLKTVRAAGEIFAGF